jgi:signal transduction histidine kinase
MTAPPVALNGGWTGFQLVDGVDTRAGRATTDLISILDNVEVPIVVVDAALSIAGFNTAAADALGVMPSHIGRACRDLFALAGAPLLEQHCREAIVSGLQSRLDFRNRDRWFVVRISPYSGRDRQPIGAVLTFTNVTAFRVSIDQAIYEREFTKAVLNSVGDPLVVLSADLRILSGNRAFYTLFGVSRDETQGIELHAMGNGVFLVDQLREQLTAIVAGADRFEPIELDDVITETGPRSLVLDASPIVLPGFSEPRLLLSFHDITARKRAEAARDQRSEEELRRSETFLADGQRLSSTGTFCWRVATDEITWSDELYRIYEIDARVPVTLDLIRTRVHPEDLSLLEKMMEARATGRDFEWHYRLLMPDHSIKYLHAVAHANRDANGQLEYIAAVQDITARHLSEEALAKVRSELTHVARVTSLGVLTASLAHELNQPLAGIITNASTSLRMLAADPPNVDGARETARRTIRDGERAAAVIKRLRALFGKKDTTMEAVDLNEAAREVIALSSSELEHKRIVVQLQLADQLPPVTGDRVQLQQVILNLLLNASDAMSSVADRTRQVVIRTEQTRDDHVRLSVRDVGIGLERQNLERVFDAFYTTKSNGMGIGLSVSRSIIESHRGHLLAETNDGPGATFSFILPCGGTS